MKRLLDEVYDSLRSIKLASILLIFIALIAILGGIIPQGRDAYFYSQHYRGLESRLILSLKLDKVFANPVFFALISLFTVNLTVCSFHRFSSELRKKRGTRRHGPDILHIGLIVLIFGGVLTAKTRTETYLALKKGDRAVLPNGISFTLTGLDFSRYEDGRPKSWSSTLLVEKASGKTATKALSTPGSRIVESGAKANPGSDGFDPNLGDGFGESGFADPSLASMADSGAGKTQAAQAGAATRGAPPKAENAGKSYTIKVNSPINLSGYSIYQQNWSADRLATLSDPAGIQFNLAPGQKQTTNDGFVLFMAEENIKNPLGAAADPSQARNRGIFLVVGGGKQGAVKVDEGQNVGPFVFRGFHEDMTSGLKIVHDNGYPFVLAGFALIFIGVFLTYIVKLKGILP